MLSRRVMSPVFVGCTPFGRSPGRWRPFWTLDTFAAPICGIWRTHSSRRPPPGTWTSSPWTSGSGQWRRNWGSEFEARVAGTLPLDRRPPGRHLDRRAPAGTRGPTGPRNGSLPTFSQQPESQPQHGHRAIPASRFAREGGRLGTVSTASGRSMPAGSRRSERCCASDGGARYLSPRGLRWASAAGGPPRRVHPRRRRRARGARSRAGSGTDPPQRGAA